MTNDYCTLHWPRSDIAVLTLNRPNKLNAVNIEMLAQWRKHLEKIAAIDTTRCLLITGAGRAFCAGADIISTAQTAKQYDGDLGHILQEHYEPLIVALRTLPFPIISVVNGLAVGVGFSFALYGDIILAAEDAYFWANFSHIGLTPDGGLSYLLPQHIGHHRALAHTLLADKISAQDAMRMGMVYEVYPPKNLMPQAVNSAMQIANHSQISIEETKRLIRPTGDTSFQDQIKAERVSQTRAGYSSEARQAMVAFLSRKK